MFGLAMSRGCVEQIWRAQSMSTTLSKDLGAVCTTVREQGSSRGLLAEGKSSSALMTKPDLALVAPAGNAGKIGEIFLFFLYF